MILASDVFLNLTYKKKKMVTSKKILKFIYKIPNLPQDFNK